mmetsp:Transcript_29948/g.67148  ORF Transcript_29948/g.67148 Transcript_29948/m.67148 type:complete len:229 (+) Transcript_29948:1993-2679(+)
MPSPHPAAQGCDALHAGSGSAGRGYDQRDGQRPARLPDGPLPHPRARHLGQDALHRPFARRRGALRDGGGRQRAQARAAARQGKPPSLGLARRVFSAGGVFGGPGGQNVQRRGGGPGAGPQRRGGQGAERGQVPRPQGGAPRQPRLPLLPGHVLGRGAGQAEQEPKPRQGLCAPRPGALGERGSHLGRARGGFGERGGPWGLLPAGPAQGRGRHAPVTHPQRPRGPVR